MPAVINNLPLRQSDMTVMESSRLPLTPRPTVLLVDDEEFLRRMLARMLNEAGFDVLEAANGSAALEAAHVVDSSVLSLVVTDLHMPQMDGIEFARELRPLHPRVPLLFITGRDPGEADDPARFNAHLLRKPFRMEAFISTIDRLLHGPLEPGPSQASA